ncbi:hypothetical protein GCM10011509_08440 [Ornithinimicrobium pekingense]|uniref:Uncharacterized protein n=1 Tax=Ornithinimicrobium pekingense TaxID=384677 RepID=A0ABQ2F595_9MICO|nr:hypothetical protein GCM10011509_08440 [Ornithinimicrobium pekingense]
MLTVDPDELDAAAAGLRRAAAELQVVARDVAGWDDARWDGPAARQQAARRTEVSTALGHLVPPLERVADGVGEVAYAAREHADTVRRHTRLQEDLALERSRLLALGAPPEPAAAALWAERLAVLEQESGWHRRMAEEAEHAFERVRHRAEALLAQVRASVPQIVWDLGLTFMTAEKAAKGWRQVSAVAAMADTLWRVHRMPVPGGERTLHRMRRRVDDHLRTLKLHPPRWISRIPGGATVAGRAVPVVAMLDAGGSVLTAGGYDGWRAGVTRGVAGVAVVGLVAVVAAPGSVVVGAAGLGAAAVYQAWMTGNWMYDNRGRIAGTAARGWAGATRVGRQAWAGGRGLLSRARERAASGLRRLRGSSPRAGATAGVQA